LKTLGVSWEKQWWRTRGGGKGEGGGVKGKEQKTKTLTGTEKNWKKWKKKRREKKLSKGRVWAEQGREDAFVFDDSLVTGKQEKHKPGKKKWRSWKGAIDSSYQNISGCEEGWHFVPLGESWFRKSSGRC